MSYIIHRFRLTTLNIALVFACSKPPVVSDSSTNASASGGSRATAPPGGSSRGGLVQRGQTLHGLLARNESHDYQIDLRAGESLHVDVTGASEPSCDSWEWSWLNPSNEWVNGNPGPNENQENRSEPRSFSVDVRADDSPPMGRWTFRLHATEHCAARLRYSLTLR